LSRGYREKGRKSRTGNRDVRHKDQEEILRYFRERSGRPLTVRELGSELGVHAGERRALRSSLDNLVAAGSLIRIKGGRYAMPGRVHLVTGRLKISGLGDGYVDPEDGGSTIVIPSARLGGAMDGDTVIVRVEQQAVGGRKAAGRVIRVVRRAHREIVAYYEEEDGLGFAQPQDDRIGPAVLVPKGREGEAVPGQLVVVGLTDYPAKGRPPRGIVKEILGSPDSLEAQIKAVIHTQGLPHRFPRKVLSENSSLPAHPVEEDLSGREDLSYLPFVTIDGEKAKDFDDALFARKNPDGTMEVFVSIADVSHYVVPGSPTDREARLRGNSVYFPEAVIPMLPEKLSNGLCSLKPRRDRLTFTCQIRIDKNGNPLEHRIYTSFIRSMARLTYRQVENHLTGNGTPLKAKDAVLENLQNLSEARGRLEMRRERRGSLDFDLPEPEVVFSDTGEVESICRAERFSSHRLVEECMLLANEIVAEKLRDNGVPGIYRVHGTPDAEKLEELNRLLASMGLRIPTAPSSPAPFQRIINEARGSAGERFLNTVILRSMMRAQYSPDPQGHFALALADYTHFTSPIRRYADLEVHRILKGLLGISKIHIPMDLESLCLHISQTESMAEEAGREILAWLRTKFMAQKTGQIIQGVVSAVLPFGFFVELEEFFIEGLVHLSSLHDDYYSYHEDKLSLVGENTGSVFRIGQSVRVKVANVDVNRRHVDFTLESKE
jgi:ribonuclease R